MNSESKSTAVVSVGHDPMAKTDPPPELAAVEARSISKFAESSYMEFTDTELAVLHRPIPADQIQERPDGLIYLDWGYYANILDEAFGTGQWSLTPAPWNPKLYREGRITYREYVLWIRGRFAANAIGHHEETRQTANFGDAAESTYANALVRCCKRLGVARDLWRKNMIEKLKTDMKNKPKNGSASAKTIDVTPQRDEVYEALSCRVMSAGNVATLKGVWTEILDNKPKLKPGNFERLLLEKENRKKALEVA